MEESIKIVKSVKLDFGLAELRSDNILTFEPNFKLKDYTVPILKEMLATFIEITEGKARPYYCNNTYVLAMLGKEEKEYIIEHFHKFATVFAMVESSPVTRLVANTVVKVYKPKVPLKMFKTKENAINWLKSLN